jgi:hypothetical protein
MKLNSALSKFLTNKLVLHIVSFIALFNIIGYMVLGHYKIVLCFIFVAFLARYFSKNMIVVLGIPIILVNMLAYSGNSLIEGLENKSDETTDKKDDKKDNKKDDKKDNSTIKNSIDAAVKDATGESVISASNEEKKDESFEVGRAKNRGYKIDYATTIEDAYDQLNSILGKDGIKNLTADTERLMQQQAQLAGSLKDMGPLMEKMSPMMEQVTTMMKTMPKDSQNEIMGKVDNMLNALKK